MKKIFHQKINNFVQGVKSITIRQETDEKECQTYIHKNFIYSVLRIEDDKDGTIEAPQIFLTKAFDTKRHIEKFCFQVRGGFLITHQETRLKVDFHHTLDIRIHWKLPVFSPNKSVILT